MLELIKDLIPVIEESKNGYWETYKDAEDKVIKKVWHQNPKNMSLESIYNEQKEKKKEKSLFVSIAPGESFVGEFVSVERITDQFGERNSFTFLVDGEEKKLNSQSFRLLENMKKAGVAEGSKVKITKEGEGFKTNYIVELVK